MGNIDEAVEEVVHFYSNYHSVRYVKDELILRLQRKPTEEELTAAMAAKDRREAP